MKRKLFRLASLIELADEEFQEARDKHQIVEKAIRDKKPLNNIEVFDEINLNTLQNYFQNSSETLAKIKEIALKAGFEFSSMNDTQRNNFLSDVVELCKIKGIPTINAFDRYLKIQAQTTAIKLKDLYKVNATPWFVSIEFVALILLIISLDDKVFEKYQHKSWGNVWENTILPYMNNRQ